MDADLKHLADRLDEIEDLVRNLARHLGMNVSHVARGKPVCVPAVRPQTGSDSTTWKPEKVESVYSGD